MRLASPLLLATALLLGACVDGVDDLAKPTLVMTGDSGFCSDTVALDADGSVFTESGCEGDSSGWNERGRVDAAAWSALRVRIESAIASAESEFGYECFDLADHRRILFSIGTESGWQRGTHCALTLDEATNALVVDVRALVSR